MQKPKGAKTIVFAREVDGRIERVEWIRHADTVWRLRDIAVQHALS